MAISSKITEEQYKTISDDFKEAYKLGRDGNYDLVLSDGGLKRAKDREVNARKEAEEKVKKLEEQIDKLTNTDAKKRGDIESLEKSWLDKENNLKKSYEEIIQKKDEYISNVLVDRVSENLANDISTSPYVMLPHITKRLKADLNNETPITRVLDKDGNLSSLTLDDFRKELIDNENFASIIKDSKSSGGSAAGHNTDGFSSVSNHPSTSPPPYANMSGKDLAASLKSQGLVNSTKTRN